MNKKIIAIAIATALTAPVAMADVKVSGRVGGYIVSADKNATLSAAEVTAFKAAGFNASAIGVDDTKATTTFGDSGQSRLEFTASVGNAFAKLAYDARANKDLGADKRENLLGYKFGSSAVSFGRMGGAIKGLEKDPYAATFLEARGTMAVMATGYGSNGFIDHTVQFTTKTNGVGIKVQYNPGTNNAIVGGDEGHMGLAVTGKVSGVNWWVGYNNGRGTETTGDTNTKFGASMKFGTIKATLQLEDHKTDGFAMSRMYLAANMGLGNGLSADVALGQGSKDVKGTWTRLAVTKKLNKGTSAYAGFFTQKPDGGDAANVVGAGMTVKF